MRLLKKKKNCVHARLRIRESFDIPKVYGREKEKKKKVAARTIIDRIGRRRGEWGEKKNPRKKIDVYTKKKKKTTNCVVCIKENKRGKNTFGPTIGRQSILRLLDNRIIRLEAGI